MSNSDIHSALDAFVASVETLLQYVGTMQDTASDHHRALLGDMYHKFVHDVLAAKMNIRLDELQKKPINRELLHRATRSTLDRIEGGYMDLLKEKYGVDQLRPEEQQLIDAVARAAHTLEEAAPLDKKSWEAREEEKKDKPRER